MYKQLLKSLKPPTRQKEEHQNIGNTAYDSSGVASYLGCEFQTLCCYRGCLSGWPRPQAPLRLQGWLQWLVLLKRTSQPTDNYYTLSITE